MKPGAEPGAIVPLARAGQDRGPARELVVVRRADVRADRYRITDTKPTVLFLCTHNAGRSQMALGFFNHLAGDQGVAWSGGSEPGNEINPSAVQAMAEVGIDITREFPKPGLRDRPGRRRRRHHGARRRLPVLPRKRYENWELPDPAGQSVDAVRRDPRRHRRFRGHTSPPDAVVGG